MRERQVDKARMPAVARPNCGYCFGETRVAILTLLIFTALSGARASGVVITKLSGQSDTLRRLPTVLADSAMP